MNGASWPLSILPSDCLRFQADDAVFELLVVLESVVFESTALEPALSATDVVPVSLVFVVVSLLDTSVAAGVVDLDDFDFDVRLSVL